MKRKTMNLPGLLFAAALPFIMLSCGGSPKGIDITDPSKIGTRLVPAIANSVGDDVTVYEISLDFAAKLNENATACNITFSPANESEVRCRSIGLGTDRDVEWTVPPHLIERTPATGIKFTELDLSVIPIFIADARRQMEQKDIAYSGIVQYNIHVDSADPGDVVHDFEFSSVFEKSRAEIKYYGYKFEVHAGDGSVNYVEGD